MKLCAVTVWYNPISLGENIVIENVLAYSEKVEKVYIIDNSNDENKMLAEKINNAVYIPLMKNEGIAKALNIGCERALEDGFEWCMTMDQDSKWDSNELDSFIEKVAKRVPIDQSIKSFAPRISQMMKHSVLGDVKQKIFQKLGKEQHRDIPVEEYCDRVICSGNIINLETWKSLGGFLEELFIDEVDYEFCYRLREADFRILKFNGIKLNHILGIPQKTFFPRPVTNHKGQRLYYIFRNMMYVNYLHPKFGKKYLYKSHIRKRILYNCLLNFNVRGY